MNELIGSLFAARDITHQLHLKTKSFAMHIALNELYDELVDLADSFAESMQGKYGIKDFNIDLNQFPKTDEHSFINALASWVEDQKLDDSYLANQWDELKALVYKTKYKIENLK